MPGVYILYSNKEIYVGRSTDLSTRTSNHLSNKKFWERIITISRKVHMDPTMLALCEGILIEKAQNIPGLICLNIKDADPAYASQSQESDARKFVGNAMLLMNIVGIKFFEEKYTSLRRRLCEGTRRKSDAINYLKDIGTILGDHVYYCSNATNRNTFAVDVDRNVADKCIWTLIANNVSNKTLTVMNIPAGLLDGIRIRQDTNKYALKFGASDFTTKVTHLCIAEFVIQRIEY